MLSARYPIDMSDISNVAGILTPLSFKRCLTEHCCGKKSGTKAPNPGRWQTTLAAYQRSDKVDVKLCLRCTHKSGHCSDFSTCPWSIWQQSTIDY